MNTPYDNLDEVNKELDRKYIFDILILEESMQSAEELAFEIASYDPGSCSIKEIVAAILIRARDKEYAKEIVEACKEAIKGEAHYVGGRPMVDRMIVALDSVLADKKEETRCF